MLIVEVKPGVNLRRHGEDGVYPQGTYAGEVVETYGDTDADGRGVPAQLALEAFLGHTPGISIVEIDAESREQCEDLKEQFIKTVESAAKKERREKGRTLGGLKIKKSRTAEALTE